MIRLIAFTPSDGWAIVREGERWWHLQPPYRSSDRRPLSEEVATRALTEQGFELRDDEFGDWGTLVRALAQECAQVQSEQERKASLDAWRSVLKRTTADRAREHLTMLEQWVEAGDAGAAERVLPVLLDAPAVACSPDMVRAAAALLERIRAAKERRRPFGGERLDWPVDDPEALRSAEAGYARLGGLLAFQQAG